MTREVDVNILHECGNICSHCSGSGEGQHDGATCWVCNGNGWIGQGEIQKAYTVEIDDDNELTGPERCEWCDLNLTELAQHEVSEGRFSE